MHLVKNKAMAPAAIYGEKGTADLSEISLFTSRMMQKAQQAVKAAAIMKNMLKPKIRVRLPKSFASPIPSNRPDKIKIKTAKASLPIVNPPSPTASIAIASEHSSGISMVFISLFTAIYIIKVSISLYY